MFSFRAMFATWERVEELDAEAERLRREGVRKDAEITRLELVNARLKSGLISPSRDAEADPDAERGAAGQMGSLALPLEALRLPPAPAVTRLEGAAVKAAITPLGQVGGGAFDPTRFFFTDSWYWTCPARDLTPIGAHWRTYLMPPAKDEQSDCDDRGFSWRVWAHIWSGYQLTQGLVMGTHPWALVDGRPYPHWYNIHVDTHHQPWLVDFPFLAEPVPWPEKATANLVVY